MIQIKGLNKFYSNGTFQALKDVSLNIEKGEFVAIMGASGSGKSTLMNILGLLDKWDGGDYYLDGKLMNGLSDDEYSCIRNKNIGFVFQSFNLIQYKTVINNVSLPLLYAGVERNTRDMLSGKILCELGLSDKINSFPSELSGGQKQRVAIARALVTNPQIVLADEPTGALDSKTSADIMNVLCAVNKTGVTVVLVTHDVKIAAYANRIIRVVDGTVE